MEQAHQVQRPIKAMVLLPGSKQIQVRSFPLSLGSRANDNNGMFAKLTTQLFASFPCLRENPLDIKITWKDSDGDHVLMTSDEELREALAESPRGQPMKVYVTTGDACEFDLYPSIDHSAAANSRRETGGDINIEHRSLAPSHFPPFMQAALHPGRSRADISAGFMAEGHREFPEMIRRRRAELAESHGELPRKPMAGFNPTVLRSFMQARSVGADNGRTVFMLHMQKEVKKSVPLAQRSWAKTYIQQWCRDHLAKVDCDLIPSSTESQSDSDTSAANKTQPTFTDASEDFAKWLSSFLTRWFTMRGTKVIDGKNQVPPPGKSLDNSVPVEFRRWVRCYLIRKSGKKMRRQEKFSKHPKLGRPHPHSHKKHIILQRCVALRKNNSDGRQSHPAISNLEMRLKTRDVASSLQGMRLGQESELKAPQGEEVPDTQAEAPAAPLQFGRRSNESHGLPEHIRLRRQDGMSVRWMDRAKLMQMMRGGMAAGPGLRVARNFDKLRLNEEA